MHDGELEVGIAQTRIIQKGIASLGGAHHKTSGKNLTMLNLLWFAVMPKSERARGYKKTLIYFAPRRSGDEPVFSEVSRDFLFFLKTY